MDGGFSFVWPDGTDPWRLESVLGVTCALLLALAWSVVVAASGWSRPTRLTAAVPAILTAAAAVISATGASSEALDSAYHWLLMAINLSAVVAFVVIGVRERPGLGPVIKVALVLLASTAAGFFPSVVDYVFMTSFSDANWDTPPGTGYPTVVAVALLALALLATTLAASPRGARRRRRDRGALLTWS